MCIRDSFHAQVFVGADHVARAQAADEQHHLLALQARLVLCLLYTSDAADERSSVDLGGRRIIKKKKHSRPHGVGDHRTKGNEYTRLHYRANKNR